MTLPQIKSKLKTAYYFNEIKQIVLVYFFAIISLAILLFLGYQFVTDANAVTTKATQLAESKDSNETLYVYLFFGAIIFLLVFYVVYAVFFYQKKFRNHIASINNFITALENGEKITDYGSHPIQENDQTLLHSFYHWELMDFEISDKNFPEEGSWFHVSQACKEVLIANYYDRYGNDKNIEETWEELDKKPSKK